MARLVAASLAPPRPDLTLPRLDLVLLLPDLMAGEDGAAEEDGVR